MKRNHVHIWHACLADIKKQVDARTYNTWFKPIKSVDLKDAVLTIQVPNPFFYEHIEQHFVQMLSTILKKQVGPKSKLSYQILMPDSRKGRKDIDTSKANFVPGTYDKKKIKNPFVIPGIKRAPSDHHVNPKYTFENFVEGKCNQLPRAAGVAIGKNPGSSSFNPLVVYGGVGLGKTHLVSAIGNEILANNPDAQMVYVSVDKFTNQIIQSIKNRGTEELVNFYQSLDIIIMDDIQFLAGRTKTQEIFFNIFNQLHSAGGQIILTSDRAPKNMEGIEERLISRFKWGLNAELESPSYETRRRILDSKLADNGIKLSEECKEYICHNIQNNIREMEGVVVAILAQSSLMSQKITMTVLKQVMMNYINKYRKEITVEGIQEIVAEHSNLAMHIVLSKSRKREIVVARQLSMYLSKIMTKNSLKSIGQLFGGKDHTTVLHACKQIENHIEMDSEFAKEVVALKRKIEMQLT